MTQEELLQWLRQVGPKSIKDITAHLGITKQSAWRRVQRLRTPDNKRLRVSEWRRPPEGSPGKFIALYAPVISGHSAVDARKPALKPAHGNPETILEYELRRSAARKEARALLRRQRMLAQHGGNPFAQLIPATQN